MIAFLRKRPLAWLFVVLVGFEALAAESVTKNSVVIDEFAHLPAGVAYWQRGLFSMYDENPPLARYLVAIPAVLSGARVDYSHAGMVRRWEWQVAHDFRRINSCALLLDVRLGQVRRRGAFRCLRRVDLQVDEEPARRDDRPYLCGASGLPIPTSWPIRRLPPPTSPRPFSACLPLTGSGGFFASPQPPPRPSPVLGLGWRWVSKFSMLILPSAWGLMALATAWSRRTALTTRLGSRIGALGFLVLAGALLTVNLLYCFRGTLTPLGSFTFTSPTLSGCSAGGSGDLVGNRFRGALLGGLPVPLPADFVIGFDSQLNDQQADRPANLSEGRLVAGGFWYSPLRTLFFKLLVGTLLLIVLALGYAGGTRLSTSYRRGTYMDRAALPDRASLRRPEG